MTTASKTLAELKNRNFQVLQHRILGGFSTLARAKYLTSVPMSLLLLCFALQIFEIFKISTARLFLKINTTTVDRGIVPKYCATNPDPWQGLLNIDKTVFNKIT